MPYCGADVATNSHSFVPKTCRTVHYDFYITETVISPDGIPKPALLVNGQMPGPTIEANWGDTVTITVYNWLNENGTTLHFHGIRMDRNNEHDGVPSVTQCPIAPGRSMTYTWTATSYGTSWYHSHFALQTLEGLFGPIVIHGLVSKDYDVDAGTVTLQDWSHRPTDELFNSAQRTRSKSPTMDNGLINGMNTWSANGSEIPTGSRFELDTQLEPDKTYLFRIINTAIQSTFRFSIDSHKMTVIAMDFTPIEPYETEMLNINIGEAVVQRSAGG